MSRRFDQALQDRPLRSQLPQGAVHNRALDGNEDGLADRRIELHVRTAHFRDGEWWTDCTCGWFGLPRSTEAAALAAACEVEDRLAVSRERRRRFLSAV